jgi:hypothetical protein
MGTPCPKAGPVAAPASRKARELRYAGGAGIRFVPGTKLTAWSLDVDLVPGTISTDGPRMLLECRCARLTPYQRRKQFRAWHKVDCSYIRNEYLFLFLTQEHEYRIIYIS